MEALRQIDAWPAPTSAAGVAAPRGTLAARGVADAVLPWASVTKLVTALAVLVAVEEGIVELDEPAGPAGSTVRHLLAHASGLPPDAGAPIAEPARRRIYSNAGFELLAEHVARRAEMPFADYLRGAVPAPLRLAA